MSLRSIAIQRFTCGLRVGRTPSRNPVNAVKTRSPHTRSSVVTYIICTNPRSGSWLLSEGLASTSLAGNPREWFNSLEEQRERAHWRMDHFTNLTYAAYLDYFQAKSMTSNGICGIKLHYYQFAELPSKLGAVEKLQGLPMAKLMSTAFPNVKYLWLRRRDKARQAISYQLACKTDDWWLIDGVKPNGSQQRNIDKPSFDPHAIARLEQGLLENDSKWKSYFQDNNIVPLVVYYEDLASDYRGTIVRVLKWLGVHTAHPVVVPKPRLKQQSNSRNEYWLKRYLAFKADRGHVAECSTSVELRRSSPLSKRLQRPFDEIPDAWQQWIARNKLLKTTDDEMVEILTSNGYSRELAITEVEKANSHPYLLAAAQIQQMATKATWLLNALRKVGSVNPEARVVERHSNLSRHEFRDKYYAANRPVIIKNLMKDWRAMTKWTPRYLKRILGDHMVEIMADRNADPNYERNGSSKHRKTVRFSDYVDMVYSGKVTNDYYLVANNAFFQRPEAQPLLRDFAVFSTYLYPSTAGQQCFLWFGPAGTVTPLHHDTSNILIAQVAGRKRYRIIPALQWQCVYNSTGVFTDVDCENPDLNRYPEFRNATIIDVIVEPGEVLFMPVGWWHHVRALDVSITVSFTNFVFPNHFALEF